MMRTLLHSSICHLDEPAQVLDEMNRHFAYLRETPLFATALYGVIDPLAERMQIACAGHPAPLLLRKGQPISPLTCDGTVPLFINSAAMTRHRLSVSAREFLNFLEA